ncbi:MFS transporter [Paraburkholderia fungorum]|jgi:AAHS family 4-hydroxybenzoate transporter-like MFS transporter|uniref:MFS transporter n=1 Tax=Paraburkholderia fungorum TaxID=134537 RepID=UPI00248D9612|nr:MFS transporter [Paraburkholderia fungorum]
MNTTNQVDLETLINSQRVGRFQILVIALCGLVAMMDGFDMQSIAFIGPEIAVAWHITPRVFGFIFSAGLLGGLVGAVLFGRIGDSRGRKGALLVTLLLVSIGSLLTPFASSIPDLIAALAFTGLGLGGAMPNFIALASEYSPGRRRASLVAMMFCGFPLGAVVGGFISARLIPLFGWQSVFFTGGAFSLFALVVAIAFIPESARLLALRGKRDKVLPILERMGCAAAWNGEVGAATGGRVSVRSLFSDGRARGTLLLWIATLLSMCMLYMLINWIPMMARRSGLSIENAVIAVAMLNLGGIVGSTTLGRVSDALGRPAIVVGSAFSIGALVIALIGYALHSGPGVWAIAVLAGFFSYGAQLCTVALSAAFYDTFSRATGIGCCMAAGRVGAIAGPIFGGMLLGSGLGAPSLFMLTGLTSLGAGVAILTMGIFVLKGRRRDPHGADSPAVIRRAT